ncbi:ScbA/BarX family gamma-butyrolactone biosynthesis protein [Streptomyces bullii]|uniref:ScbA/BarX family gamma-butyrolactone biosynthesis protein n=1 Tax=Streptomyces bullii TaxID=349910 RepID=A0ABW0URS7_9ACTN
MAPGTTRRIVDLSFPAPDPKRYAGKVDLTEVLVTDWHPEGEHTDAVTVRWPCRHAFYTPGPHPDYGLLLFAESVRQSLAVTCHLGLGVPMGHRMGWETLTSTVRPDAMSIGTEPATVDLTIHHEDVERRKSGLVRLTARVRATRDGMPLGTAEVRYTAYPPALYDRLRGPYADAREAFARSLPPGPAIDPALVGRTDPRDVVLTADPADPAQGATGAPRRWLLRTDTTHPVLFDHPHDHVPGMVLLEAVSQAARAAAPRDTVPIAFDTSFHRYVEFDLPCAIVADEPEVDEWGRRRQRVDGLQDGRTVFTAVVTSVDRGDQSAVRARQYQIVA